MKLKHLPLIAIAALTLGTSASEAINFGKIGRKIGNMTIRAGQCDWPAGDVGQAISNYERLTTPLPEGLNRQVNLFQESDFQTKPWLRDFEYVVVVNNSNSWVQNEQLPEGLPFALQSLAELGIRNSSNDMTDPSRVDAAKRFQSSHGDYATQVRRFGSYQRVKNSKGQLVGVPSRIPGAQTVRIYQNGRLIHTDKISTGRHEFELRGWNYKCGTRPAESYFSVTESGYFTFEELIKDYSSKSYDDAAMPNSMFYLRKRGLALHGVTLESKIKTLGQRASGGCTRMRPETAQSLFEAIKSTQGRSIPVIDVHGNPVLDANGQLTYKSYEFPYGNPNNNSRSSYPTYSALLIIQPESP